MMKGKSLSPLFPMGGEGQWIQMTDALLGIANNGYERENAIRLTRSYCANTS